MSMACPICHDWWCVVPDGKDCLRVQLARAKAAQTDAYQRGAEAMRAAIVEALRGPTGGIPVEQVARMVEVPK
jgi:hypothetical protein